jgi:hypothetical protein
MPHIFYDGPRLLGAIHGAAALGMADTMIGWRYFDLEAQLYGGLSPKRVGSWCHKVLLWESSLTLT